MGLKSKIVEFIGHEYVDSLEKKDPGLFAFLDALNELTIIEAIKIRRDINEQMGNVTDEGPVIDWMKYAVRFTQEPFVRVITDLLAEYGLTEIGGIAIKGLLAAISEVGSDGK